MRSLFTEVGDHDNGGTDDLTGLTLLVDLAESSPLAEDLIVRNLDQLHASHVAQSRDQRNIARLITVLRQEAHQRQSPVDYLAALMKSLMHS